MQRSLKTALVLSLSGGALANYCLAGQKHKDNLVGLHCIMGTEDAASCHTECCEKDPKKCAGRDPKPTCDSDEYFGTDFTSMHTDVPSGTAAEAKKVCCKKKAKCSQATCPAGYKLDDTKSGVLCAGDSSTCVQNNICCIKDANTCGGQYATAAFTAAATTHYVPTGSQQTTAWKNTVVDPAGNPTQALAKTKCQKERKAKCDTATYNCPAGLTKQKQGGTEKTQLPFDPAAAVKTPTHNELCPSDDASCVTTCCVVDKNTCGGLALPAAGSQTYFKTPAALTPAGCTDTAKFFDPAQTQADLGEWDLKKNEPKNQKAYAMAWAKRPVKTGATAAEKEKACCLPRPACSSHKCPAGKKMKTGLPKTTLCLRTDTCTSDCCEDDATTCGGLANIHGIQCKYGFYNEMDSWNTKTTQAVKDAFKSKNATLGNKNTACCTPRAACAIPGTSTPAPGAITTTPAAVVTTTPAAAALKFSEHKIATEASQSTGSNMLWLGVGALVGMGVLMVVQGLRSKTQARDQQISAEDANALLDSNVE